VLLTGTCTSVSSVFFFLCLGEGRALPVGRQQGARSQQGWEDDAQFGDVGGVDPHTIEAISYVKLNEVDGAIAGVGIEKQWSPKSAGGLGRTAWPPMKPPSGWYHH
jgi:hypothetical protein